MQKTTSVLAFAVLVLAVGYAQDHLTPDVEGTGQFPNSASATTARLHDDAASSSSIVAPVCRWRSARR